MIRTAILFGLLSLPLLTACGSSAPAAGGITDEPAPPATTAPSIPATSAPSNPLPASGPTPLALHFVMVNGLLDPADYLKGESALKGLEDAVLADVKLKAPAYEAAHNVKIAADAIAINVYTDLNGNVPTPGTDDGTGQQVATHWRSQLSLKLAKAFPNGEKNIILIGHSTGARASMEVAADVGEDNQILTGNWGFRDRIAGVVSAHGMLDALGNYTTSAHVVSFDLGCKVAKKAGWCDYASDITSWPAADWVAKNKRSLILTSIKNDCGAALWDEDSDQALPTRAQGSPASAGLGLAQLPSGSYSAAHGNLYGSFCHSDITEPSTERGAAAVVAATGFISKWLFESAPVTVNPDADDQIMESPVLPAGTMSVVRPLGAACPTLMVPVASAPIELVGNCSHPGLFDGNDHAMTPAQLFVTSNATCGGSVQWKNVHTDSHAGTIWFKAYAQAANDPSFLGTLLGR